MRHPPPPPTITARLSFFAQPPLSEDLSVCVPALRDGFVYVGGGRVFFFDADDLSIFLSFS